MTGSAWLLPGAKVIHFHAEHGNTMAGRCGFPLRSFTKPVRLRPMAPSVALAFSCRLTPELHAQTFICKLMNIEGQRQHIYCWGCLTRSVSPCSSSALPLFSSACLRLFIIASVHSEGLHSPLTVASSSLAVLLSGSISSWNLSRLT